MEPTPSDLPVAGVSTPHCRSTPELARVVLAAFLFTFALSRIVVLLIMSRALPDLYMHMGGTHVHHLNYGIFILSFIGAFSIFNQPRGKLLTTTAAIYGVGLGLTFDEFGMWVHLGGPYWQRVSFDAVVVIAAIFGLIAAAPRLAKFRPRHIWTAALMALVLTWFGVLLARSVNRMATHIESRTIRLEMSGPE